MSSIGRIRNSKKEILKPCRARNGYIHVTLHKGGTKKQVLLHRLIATTFLPHDEGRNVVNHINCNPSDNRIENLEWTTQSKNIKYAYDLGREDCVARKRIKCLDVGKSFYSSMDAATWVNLVLFHDSHNLKTISRTIRQCANRERGHQSAYGMRWVFCNDEGSTTIP